VFIANSRNMLSALLKDINGINNSSKFDCMSSLLQYLIVSDFTQLCIN